MRVIGKVTDCPQICQNQVSLCISGRLAMSLQHSSIPAPRPGSRRRPWDAHQGTLALLLAPALGQPHRGLPLTIWVEGSCPTAHQQLNALTAAHDSSYVQRSPSQWSFRVHICTCKETQHECDRTHRKGQRASAHTKSHSN